MNKELSNDVYLKFASFLHSKLGIVLGNNRQYLVKSRLSTLANQFNYEQLDHFVLDVVKQTDATKTTQALELMTTNETFWFRDQYPFSILSHTLFPALASHKRKLKIWCCACASGQEPYSIAMTAMEYKAKNPSALPYGIEILATDYSSKMIAQASEGQFDQLQLSRGLPSNLRDKYFKSASENKMQVDQSIRRLISFKQLNLLDDYARLGKFDVIFCRNVLIYFDGNQKLQILNKIAACLPVSGALFLGAAESISGAEQQFKLQNTQDGLYYSKA